MINWFPFIEILFAYIKLEGGDIIVDNRPHDYETVNEIVFEVKGVLSSTVDITI